MNKLNVNYLLSTNFEFGDYDVANGVTSYKDEDGNVLITVDELDPSCRKFLLNPESVNSEEMLYNDVRDVKLALALSLKFFSGVVYDYNAT